MVRTVMFVILLATISLGPGSAPHTLAQDATPASDCAPTTEAENATLVRGYYDAIFSGDVDNLDPFLAAEVVRHGGGTIPFSLGPEDIKRNFALYFDAFPDLQSEFQHVVVDGDLVAVRTIERGTHQAEFIGIPATGNEATWGIFAIYRIDCGQIVEYWSQIDDLGRLQQLGVIPQPMISIAATPAAASPDDTAASPAECATTTEAENVALVERWYDEVYIQGNFANIAEILAPDHIRHGLHRDSTGIPSRQAAVEVQQAAFPDLVLRVDFLLAEGDLVVARWTASGTHDGPWQDFAPTGNAVTWTGNTLYQIACGRIAEEWAEADLLPVYEAIGAIALPDLAPPPDSTPVD